MWSVLYTCSSQYTVLIFCIFKVSPGKLLDLCLDKILNVSTQHVTSIKLTGDTLVFLTQTYEKKLTGYREHLEESQPSLDASLSKVQSLNVFYTVTDRRSIPVVVVYDVFTLPGT